MLLVSVIVCPDHPRSRGVYGAPADAGGGLGGSSPLARGLLDRINLGILYRRIIPARAGFTDAAQVDDAARPRIIPARAGFTPPPRKKFPRKSDHPRSRGVYIARGDNHDLSNGSSPLARGLLSCGSWPHDSTRIIPARAGFTRCGRDGSGATSDHPRSRGVYSRRRGRRGGVSGSSPLARGLRLGRLWWSCRVRIIPARAGFTWASHCDDLASSDHPRSRGVYLHGMDGTVMDDGSSPLARGLRDFSGDFSGRGGIIPARAGFTPSSQVIAPYLKDHPRSRGVYLPASHVMHVSIRIIPARAGFTHPCPPR